MRRITWFRIAMVMLGCFCAWYAIHGQTTANIQIILDAVQATYPGNEGVKQCGPDNHDGVCYDPNKPHLVYHIYIHKEHCEHAEGVKCRYKKMPYTDARWIPIGKPMIVVEAR